MGWKALDDMDLRGKRVLVRVDINVPVENGKVTDDTRIQRIIPTLRDILEQGGTPVLLAHFGRPKGKRVQDLSLRVVLPALEDALGRKVVLAETLEAAEAGTEEILTSTSPSPTLMVVRPSWGRRRSAMSILPMIFTRLTIASRTRRGIESMS